MTLSNRISVTLQHSFTKVFSGERITLVCKIKTGGDTEWVYEWRTTSSHTPPTHREYRISSVSVSHSGRYWCKGRRDSYSSTEWSNALQLSVSFSNKAVVTSQPNWPLIFSGETITVICDIHERGNTAWEYEWSKPNSNTTLTDNECRISSATVSDSGNYRCMGKKKWDLYSSTEWSDVITLTVSSHRPKANLSADNTAFPAGGSATLTCSVSPPSFGWKYLWFREQTAFQHLTTQEFGFLSNGQISVSQEGLYTCIGERGDPIYYTEYSDSIRIYKIATKGAVVTMQPNWPELYSGETVTLRCEIQGGDTKWEYEWMTTSSFKPPNQNEYTISSVSPSHIGDYWCKGRLERAQKNSTGWSISFKLTASYKPQPVLTVSPLWLSPGASVTLNCSVKHPSAGWRFFWYKAVPKLSDNSYSYELIPGSIHGTEQDSYIVDGQTHTAGYVCRAGRGDPVYYTHYSQPKFVWSGEFNPAASLTVTPDRVQHFFSESVSLSCEGNATKWKVMRYTETGQLSHCSGWGRMTGSTCNIHSLQYGDGVYWCESGSGKYSNAVNITVQSPKPEDCSFLLPLLTGVLTGALLVILPLLLYCFMKSNDLCYSRSTQCQTTNQDERVHRDEMQQQTYSSLLEGGVCIYESLGGCEDTGKGLDKRSKHEEPVDTNVP
ncbi:hypothetical protein ABVT39_007465 [Epinephelus coioides]